MSGPCIGWCASILRSLPTAISLSSKNRRSYRPPSLASGARCAHSMVSGNLTYHNLGGLACSHFEKPLFPSR
jgi:hypothetical protein